MLTATSTVLNRELMSEAMKVSVGTAQGKHWEGSGKGFPGYGQLHSNGK